jgi:UDP:flavonoid glycosyltransferase YjiC (YdhE family)
MATMICLMPMCAYLSETSRMIQIYKALRAQGAEARIATHGGIHETLLQSEGIPYDIVGPRMTAERGTQFIKDNVGLGHPGQSMYSPNEMRTYVSAEVNYFRRHKVEAVVTGFTLTALLSTRVAGISLITEHAGAFIPPLFERGLLPAASNPVQPIFRYMPDWLAAGIQNKLAIKKKLYLKGFNALAAEIGVQAIPSFPALILGDLVLVTEAPDVYGVTNDEMMQWRPHGAAYWPSTRFRYTGPLFAAFDLPVPDDIERVLKGPHPIVYVALTSVSEKFVRRVVAGVAASGAQVIVAGTVHDVSDLANECVTVGGVMPSHKIMPRVDLAVTMGGQGSVQCAMAAGTPIIGIPLHREQDSNVHFLARRGAAELLPLRKVTEAGLNHLVGTMLNQASYRQAAQSIQRAYASMDGPRLCASAIIEHVRNKQSALPVKV